MQNIFVVVFTLGVIFSSNFCLLDSKYTEDTLQLAHIVFRHGNRTPEPGKLCPSDPYFNFTFAPYGLGQLTNVLMGKRTIYQLGETIRSRYNKFLGSLYTPDLIDAVSSDYNRTKMSMGLFLAGLFPPKGTPMDWNKDLNWQPIPYNYVSTLNGNYLLVAPTGYCQKHEKLYDEFLRSQEGKRFYNKHKQLLMYLLKYTDCNITAFSGIANLYSTLTAEDDWGLPLPEWTKPVYPDAIREVAGEHFYSNQLTTEMKQLTGGFLLKKIIEDTKAKIDGTLNPAARKFFIYSAHDVVISYLIGSMNIVFPYVPPYGAYILVELHKINNVYGIMLFYQNYEQSEPVLLKVPGCFYFCPFNKFVELLKDNLPENENACDINYSKEVDSVEKKEYY